MADNSSSLKWFFKNSDHIRALPSTPRPIRDHYLSDPELFTLGAQLGKGTALSLPNYESFNFEKRLSENGQLILHSFRAADAAARNDETITPAAQWLLDNHYTIDKTIQQARRDFPVKFLRQLPAYDPIDGIPRVFALAWLYVAHTDSVFSVNSLTEMVKGFQTEAPFQIGELWALPSAIRYILVENARRLSLRVERARRMRFYANQVADKVALAQSKSELDQILTHYAPMVKDSTFASHLLYRLSAASLDTTQALDWLEQQLKANNSDSEQASIEENNRQSSGGVTMGNIIRAMKAIDDVDWSSWFESVSHVDALLREQSDFANLDFHSRNAYRVTIEKIARRSTMDELDVASKALELSNKTIIDKDHPRPDSVAWYLVGDGISELEQACSYKPTLSQRFMRWYRGLGLWNIAAPVSILTLVVLAIIYGLLRLSGMGSGLSLLFVFLSVFPVMDGVYALFNTIVSWFVKPTRLIGYEFKQGVPQEAATLVAVPTLITSRDNVDEQIRNLEVHYLTNPKGSVSFALVTDWADSSQEIESKDHELLDYARKAVEDLNRHYCGEGEPRFFILHRRRLFNAQENCWMGWERKRGKLHELNLLLRGDQDTSFLPTENSLPNNIQYIMTLDSDTRLTSNAVTRLVGKMHHPLNCPQIDATTRTVSSGYAILQPRVTPSLTTGDEASFLQRIFSANRGIDPYVFAISDTYQDLLNEGSFTGKGLYHLDAFETVMEGRVRENTVLSHDLLEGGFARCAYITDVEVIEDYPTGYNVDAARHHRWVRGDWQLLSYLFSSDKAISMVTRWKMLDNLRRSLSPLMWLLAALAGWCFMSLSTAFIWQISLLLGLFVGPTLGMLANILPQSMDNSIRGHIQNVISSFYLWCADIYLRVSFLAYTAYFMSDAIVRTFYRMFISHKNLLEWRSSAQTTQSAPDTLRGYIQLMWPASAIGLACAIIPFLHNQSAAFIALPFALLWFISPVTAWLVSRSAAPQDSLDVRQSDKGDLRRYARRTWLYFETFANEENNFLPPDNYQEDPYPLVAPRTSPTNIGVYLLSIVSARDFGWIGFNDALERIALTLETYDKLEKHRGHMYNWYDTTTLQPLEPLYISTVDSGNLAGHFVTLSSSLREWADAPSVYLQGDLGGLLDVNDILEETLKEIPDDRRVLRPLRRRIEERLANFRRAVRTIIDQPETATFRTINLSLAASDIARFVEELHAEIDTVHSERAAKWAKRLIVTCEAHTTDALGEHDAGALRDQLLHLAQKARQFAFDMKFDFLENKERQLLSIGYRVQLDELDESCYDLLASEARLSSLFAIAKGDVKVEHWFRLGRLLVPVGWRGALLSWSGSMFEYLMPPLVMNEPLGSLLDQTNRLIVRRQREYARQRGLPWGISEAAYNMRDQLMNYQYSNFGVPSLGLQRGLSRNAVIAPYASLLAAQYSPAEAVENLKTLQKFGALGEYGFHDSVDFTPSRVRDGEKCAVVQNYYAHHHGMSIIAVNNVVYDGRMRKRFHSDPVIEAAELLLQEKAPREIPMVHAKTENPMRSDKGGFENAPMRIVSDPLKKPRATVLLADSAYSVMLNANGAGYSRWNGYDITRFNMDSTEDQQGTFIFLRDMNSGRWWSATGEPTRVAAEHAVTVFTDEKAEFQKTVDGIQSTLECIVTHEVAGEGRRIELVNTTDTDRIIEITSYGELVLTTTDTDAAHPAFSRMFVETEIADQGATIFAKRRKRAPNDPDIHMAHFVSDLSGSIRDAEAETDRRVFIGRGRSLRRPAAFDKNASFSGTEGCVLDPVAAIRCRVRVPAHKKASLIYWTIVGDNQDHLKDHINRLRQSDSFSREFSHAWTRAQVMLYQIGLRPNEAADCQKLASSLIYNDRIWRVAPEHITQGLGKQSNLWPMAISGDFPILVLRINNETDLNVLRGLLKAFEYWRLRGLVIDLVILNERGFSYAQDTQRAIEWLCESYRLRSEQGGTRQHIFTVRRDQMDESAFQTLLASARIVMHAQNGTLSEQLKRLEDIGADLAARENYAAEKATRQRVAPPITEENEIYRSTSLGLVSGQSATKSRASGKDLRFWNGYGGFDDKGAYHIRLTDQISTPHPWINVLANKDFGMHISAEGAPFNWAGNSRDYQLTPWANDPVANRPGEALYVVDRKANKVFSPVAAVERDPGVTYEACHGFGYSSFRSRHDDIALELTYIVDPKRQLRLSRFTIHNKGKATKTLGIYHYVEWVLGNMRSKTAPYIVPSFDPDQGVLFAANPYHTDKAEATSFICASSLPTSVTSDRSEFITPTGTVKHPGAVRGEGSLSNTVEAGLDPCSAMHFEVTLGADEQQEIVFYMGHSETLEGAQKLAHEAKSLDFDTIYQAATGQWDDFLSTLQVETKDPSFDLLVNGWLPYQNLACRILARAAFYQASGAYGFRDQLQDTLALLLLKPELAREQIINAASRQFIEGDVQHWWLPGTGAGVRTLISDDVAWLGYGTALYVETTGDTAILNEQINFIEGPQLDEGQHDAFYQPEKSGQITSLYEHCALALNLAIKRTGPHGLPLILGGDWNDGMNLVGVEGRGESVWLGWFLGYALQQFIPLAQARGDMDHVTKWQAHIDALRTALNDHGWDGAWYRRGYFDNGTPLGSHESDECQIDTIAQSWSVLSGLGSQQYQNQAMDSMLSHLLDKQGGLLRLFTPPFDKSDQEPGYIKGYPPGVRENGGQYTHGAIWSILALTEMGRNDDAYQLFSLINPINHGETPDIYRVEPYVIAADIYSVEERRGRGGWTWYTGSAGWFYRAATEAILGIRRRGERLFINPSLPSDWPGYKAVLRLGEAQYTIHVEVKGTKAVCKHDGKIVKALNEGILLATHGEHDIHLTLAENSR